MGLYGKTKSGNNESWGLGLLLVFFLDDENNEDHQQQHNNNNNNQKYNENKKKNLATSSPFKSSPSSGRSNTPSFFNNNKLLISKAQSTISICALLVFFTLFVFTLSTFEPSIHSSTSAATKFPRRWLPEKINYSHLDKTHVKKSQISSYSVNNFALQGMGTLFRRGTKPMNDLIVAHLTEDITDYELQLFLRTLHRSSVTAKSDVVFIYSSSFSPNFTSIIHQENESFLKLVHHHRRNGSAINVAKKLKTMINSFDVTQFSKSDNKGESLWGKRIRTNSNHSNNNNSAEGDINELSIGSMVGFETAELDPEDSLSGFFNNPPSIRMRRWACYPMLLGRVRRNFKHIMLVNVKDVVLLGDSMSRVRSRSAESVHLWMMNKNLLDKTTQSHNKKDQSKQPLTADLIMGGMRGIRRLSNAMLNEIVRATMKHKGKTNTISDSGILSQLIHNESLLKHIEVSVTTESAIPDTSSLVNSKRNSGLTHHHHHHHQHQNIVHRGNRNVDLNSILLRELCSSSVDSLVYSDC
ncbi:hypothetical protein C5167_046255 [Papaver somniferum]|uniref:DUF7780 domain-containing protein n=1 Tax=Papaver somniferum TaxID=3469 RepID=A0A4Y7LEU7_PAPSO|nr:uncharacterized protein LOC113323070 [Papaver somniferum]RZC83467.1 hypothetical protein C5167_046255 [Papaver somniferum]